MLPAIQALPESHPRRRFVGMLCLVWRELRSDGWDMPDEQAAAVLARAILMPDEEFIEHLHEADEVLAARFNVPLDEIGAKRDDLGMSR